MKHSVISAATIYMITLTSAAIGVGCTVDHFGTSDIAGAVTSDSSALSQASTLPLMATAAAAGADHRQIQVPTNPQELSAQRHRQPVTDLFAVAEGRWVGKCTLSFPGQDTPALKFEMERIVAPTDVPGVYEWTIIYRSEEFGEQVRPYSMLSSDTPGRYILDENNGILITHYLFESGVMMSEFDVPGVRLTSRDTFRRNRSRFEITTTSIEPELSTGTAEFPVNSSQVQSMQKCSLRRSGD